MKPLASFTDRIGEALFDIHMNVFQLYRKVEFIPFDLSENILQPLDDSILICFGNNALPGQHRRMGNAAADILCIHTAIELNRCVKCFYVFICSLCKPAAP